MAEDQRAFPERRKGQSIPEIIARLDEGDKRMTVIEDSLHENTAATQQIAVNTAGIVKLTTELAAGTKFLCRVAIGIQFCLELIDKYWKRALLAWAFIYWLTHGHQLPDWAKDL